MAKLQSHWGEQVAKDLAAINPKQLGRVGVLMGGAFCGARNIIAIGRWSLKRFVRKGGRCAFI